VRQDNSSVYASIPAKKIAGLRGHPKTNQIKGLTNQIAGFLRTAGIGRRG
jgi:hypothetical protein